MKAQIWDTAGQERCASHIRARAYINNEVDSTHAYMRAPVCAHAFGVDLPRKQTRVWWIAKDVRRKCAMRGRCHLRGNDISGFRPWNLFARMIVHELMIPTIPRTPKTKDHPWRSGTARSPVLTTARQPGRCWRSPPNTCLMLLPTHPSSQRISSQF